MRRLLVKICDKFRVLIAMQGRGAQGSLYICGGDDSIHYLRDGASMQFANRAEFDSLRGGKRHFAEAKFVWRLHILDKWWKKWNLRKNAKVRRRFEAIMASRIYQAGRGWSREYGRCYCVRLEFTSEDSSRRNEACGLLPPMIISNHRCSGY